MKHKPAIATRQGQFFLWSVLLMLSGVWAVLDDFTPEYKKFQKGFDALKLARAQEELERENARVEGTYRESLDDLDRRIQNVRDVSESLNAAAQIEAERIRLTELAERERILAQGLSFAKSKWGAARSQYEFKKNDPHTSQADVDDAREVYDTTFAKVLELSPSADAAFFDLEAQKTKLKDLEAGPVDLVRQRDQVYARMNEWRAEVERIRPSDMIQAVANVVRNQPLLDWVDPSQNLMQIVMPDNPDITGSAKVDRCITCHLGIDNPELDLPNLEGPDAAYKVHPNLDLFVGRDSTHPMSKFGCTTCHLGRGYGSTFTLASHTPNDHEQEEEWKKRYGWKELHYWDYPMLPERNMEAMCFSCHDNSGGYELTMARDVFEGRKIYENRGCVGCHKITGLSEDMKRVGPSLRMIGAKLNEDWAPRWISGPRDFYAEARMPHPFGHAIPDDENFPEYNQEMQEAHGEGHFEADREKLARDETAIVDAIAAFLFDNSTGWEGMVEPPGPGDVERGRALVSLDGGVNCLGCHTLREPAAGIDAQGNGYGPDLSKVGSKTNRKWVYNWLLDPGRYWPDGNMPNPRLEPDEASDISAYLMTLRDDAYMAAEKPEPDAETLREIAIRYKRATLSEAQATADVDAMASLERKLYVGGEAIYRYGCFGCHTINDEFDARPNVGAELTGEGFKEIELFDFGMKKYVHLPHTRHDWIRQKVLHPQIYMLGKVTNPYEATPMMPWFGLSEEEADQITTFVLAQTGRPTPPAYEFVATGEQAAMYEGWKIMERRNCIGCHKIGLGERYLTRAELNATGQFASDHIWVSNPVVARYDPNLPEGKYVTIEQVEPDKVVMGNGESDLVLLEADEFIVGDVSFGDIIFFAMKELLVIDEAIVDVGMNNEIRVAMDRPDLIRVYGVDEGYVGRYFDDPAMAPPVLRREGAKVRMKWLVDFLGNVETVRNHIQIRMPQWQWTQEELIAVARSFSAMAGEPFPWPEEEIAEYSELHEDVTLKIFGVPGTEEYLVSGQCFSCHPAGALQPTKPMNQWAPNLFLAKERLKVEFIKSWIRFPGAWDPESPMPQFFYERVDRDFNARPSIPATADFGGSDRTIELLAEAIYYMDQNEDIAKAIDDAARAAAAVPTPPPPPR